jgi:hypothetical protein
MSVNDTNRNGSMPTTVEESTLPVSLHEPPQARESTVVNGKPELAAPFAARTDVKGVEGISPGRNHIFEINLANSCEIAGFAITFAASDIRLNKRYSFHPQEPPNQFIGMQRGFVYDGNYRPLLLEAATSNPLKMFV